MSAGAGKRWDKQVYRELYLYGRSMLEEELKHQSNMGVCLVGGAVGTIVVS